MKKFIALLSLTLSMTAMADTNYSCLGTEPFWGLDIVGENVTFSNPVLENSTVEQVSSRTTAAGVQEDFAFVLTTENSISAISQTECSDGMSDEVYSHQIIYKNADSVLYGCCNIIK
jgi:uncharacterized membrane protein